MIKKRVSATGAESKVTIVKKNTPKPKKILPVKFDKEGFFLAWGIGIVVTGIGVLIIWATNTAPAGGTNTGAYTVAQRLAKLMPESTKETLAMILGGLFILFGLFCLFLGLRIVFKYLRDKAR
jgi:hypothetical protein